MLKKEKVAAFALKKAAKLGGSLHVLQISMLFTSGLRLFTCSRAEISFPDTQSHFPWCNTHLLPHVLMLHNSEKSLAPSSIRDLNLLCPRPRPSRWPPLHVLQCGILSQSGGRGCKARHSRCDLTSVTLQRWAQRYLLLTRIPNLT